MIRPLPPCPSWPVLLFALVVSLYCTTGALLLAWPKGATTPLVGAGDWRITGQFFATPRPTALELPSQILASPQLQLWRSWSPQTAGTTGSIVSAPFDAHSYLAIPFYGFPGEVAGNTVTLRCLANGKTIPVADQRTNTVWAIAYLHPRPGFCPSKLRIEAQASSTQFYVGIGTPCAISAAAYAAAKAFPTRGLTITIVWAWFVALIAICAVAWQRVFGPRHALTAGFAGMGLLGLCVFFIYHFSPTAGRITTSLLAAIVPASGAALAIARPESAKDFLRSHGHAFLLWLVIAWSYACLVSAIDNGGGSWSINAAFAPLRWSFDNQIPLLFADAMYDGTPRSAIGWTPWLASDRPPLLSGLLLLLRWPLLAPLGARVNSEFVVTGYMMASIVLLSSWVIPVYRFGEKLCAQAGPYLVGAAALSPFFLFNTVYGWPKLLGASYALLVWFALSRLRTAPRDRAALLLAGICAALSILCHASNALIFPVILLLRARPIWRQGLRSLSLAAAAMLAVLAPWQVWQSVVQPHGNALIRYALAGDLRMGDRTRPIAPDVIAAYRALGFSGWLASKLDGLTVMAGSMRASVPLQEAASFGPGAGFIGNLRIGDFFSLLRGIGVAGVAGLLLLPLAARSAMNRHIAQTALCGIGGVALTALVFLPTPITHQLPYAAVALLLLAGAAALLNWPRLRLAILLIEAAYCGVVWIAHPLACALRIEPTALAGLVAGLGVLLNLVWTTRQLSPTRAPAPPPETQTAP